MQTGLISVIIPVYKVEKYLDKCVESVVNQTYKNLEIILVDDGSPDNCPKMCDDWAQKDDRIKVIHKQNGGLSDARNSGLDIATAEYIAFIDSDDFVSPIFIETLYNDLIETGSDVASVGFFRFSDYSKINPQELEKNSKITIFEDNEKFYQLYSNKNAVDFVVAWNKLYKKSIFDNIKYPVGKINEDEFVAHKILATCNKICFRTSKLYYYLQRNNSIMHTNYSEKNTHYIDAFENRIDFFKTIDKTLFYIALADLLEHLIGDYFIKNSIKNLVKQKYNVIYKKYKKDIRHLKFKLKLKLFLFNHLNCILRWHYKKLIKRG